MPAGSGAPAVPVPVATSLSLPASLLNHQESKAQLPSGFRFSRQVAVSLSRCLGARRPGARSPPARRAAGASGAYLRPCQRTARGRGRSRQGGSPPEPSPPPAASPGGAVPRGSGQAPRSDAPRPRGLAKLLPPTPPPPSPAGGTAARLRSRCRGDSPRRANTALRGGRPGQVDGGRRDKTGSEGREGPRGLRPSGLRLRPFKGGSWLITVLLKTLIFIRHPYGTASLAYLSAGLALFLAGTLIAQLFTQLRESAQSSGESELW